MNKNILITSVGRRVELIKIWELTLMKIMGSESKLFVTDSNFKYSPACALTKNVINISDCKDPNYIKILLEQAIKNKIRLIIPCIDSELKILSINREYFRKNGIEIIISDLKIINYSENKKLTFELFSKLNLKSPKIFKNDNIKYPCFMKPIKGSSSIGIKKAFSENDLTFNEKNDSNNIFQELIPSNWIEYSADLYFSKSGHLISCVPRERIQTRGGEISKGITRKNQVYKYLLKNFKTLKGARGPITLQLFVDQKFFEFIFIEINPRFGGGYPISHEAGVNYPELILKEYLLNKLPDFVDNWKEDILALRYDEMVIKKL